MRKIIRKTKPAAPEANNFQFSVILSFIHASFCSSLLQKDSDYSAVLECDEEIKDRIEYSDPSLLRSNHLL